MAVEISLPESLPSDAEAEADLQALLDLKRISAKDVRKLQAVGVNVKRQGMVETQRGVMMVNQSWCLGITSQLHRMLMKKLEPDECGETAIGEISKLGELITKMFGKQAEMSVAMLAQEPRENGDREPPTPANRAFPPGSVVIGGNAQAHFHQTPPANGVEKDVAKPPEAA